MQLDEYLSAKNHSDGQQLRSPCYNSQQPYIIIQCLVFNSIAKWLHSLAELQSKCNAIYSCTYCVTISVLSVRRMLVVCCLCKRGYVVATRLLVCFVFAMPTLFFHSRNVCHSQLTARMERVLALPLFEQNTPRIILNSDFCNSTRQEEIAVASNAREKLFRASNHRHHFVIFPSFCSFFAALLAAIAVIFVHMHRPYIRSSVWRLSILWSLLHFPCPIRGHWRQSAKTTAIFLLRIEHFSSRQLLTMSMHFSDNTA